MRNTKRIPKLLNKFKKIWQRNPDIRFGQLVCILANKNNCEDIFNVEDDIWEKWCDWENCINKERC